MSEPVNFLQLSDEEMLNMAPPEPVAATATAAAVVEQSEPVDKVVETQDLEAKDPEGGNEGGDQDPGTETASDEPGDQPGEEGKVEGDPVKETQEADPKDPKDPATENKDEKKADETPKDESKVDFEAEYKRLLTPFKANGRDIAVKSVDDAIALMQMGANYNKKMAALKPNLKLMKMLETSGFMSEEKIGFLIDLGKKDPAAISKLVKDSGVDPMDLDAEKASAYKQSTYAATDREVELDTVLDEISDSPSYTRTLGIVSNKWDAASKQVIVQNPQLMKVINDHVDRGIYDRIATEVENSRMLGRLNGLSDIEAYRQVGDALQAKGGFNDLSGVAATQAKTEIAAPVVVQPKPTKVEDDKLKDKRRAASSTKPAAPSAAAKDFNPLGMSDEEFSKLIVPKFL